MSALALPDEPVIACLDCPCLCPFTGCPTGETWRQCADVLYADRPRPCRAAAPLASRTLRRYPGCVLVVVRRVEGGWWHHSHRQPPGGVLPLRRTDLTGRELTRLVCEWYAELLSPSPC